MTPTAGHRASDLYLDTKLGSFHTPENLQQADLGKLLLHY